jgi:hypothetical protein
VQLIETGATAERVLAALQTHIETRDMSKYAVDDLPLLGRRLLGEAENDLGLLLAYLYRLGYRHMQVYSSRSQLASDSELWPDVSDSEFWPDVPVEETLTASQEYVSSVGPDSIVKVSTRKSCDGVAGAHGSAGCDTLTRGA